jgi:hypothetical protein
MTTTRRDDPGTPPAGEDERFVRWLADAYTPPPMTPALRSRFDAHLEERLGRRVHRRPWLAVVATASLALALWGAWDARVAVRGAAAPESPDAVAASADAALGLASEPAADAEEGLPAEYRAISYLLIDDAQGDATR